MRRGAAWSRAPAKGRVEQLARRLDDPDLLVLMLDGLRIARHTMVVALGILGGGRKLMLRPWQGSTENSVLCTSLLQGLCESGSIAQGWP